MLARSYPADVSPPNLNCCFPNLPPMWCALEVLQLTLHIPSYPGVALVRSSWHRSRGSEGRLLFSELPLPMTRVYFTRK